MPFFSFCLSFFAVVVVVPPLSLPFFWRGRRDGRLVVMNWIRVRSYKRDGDSLRYDL